MKTALVIMAAGLGTRFGEGIKQLTPVGPKGELIIDYSIFDALGAGFNKVIFIIRKDIEDYFKEIIGNRISEITEVEYAFQDLNDLPEGFSLTEGRTKPWGTAQAVLSARDVIKEPFAVINADDFYGREAFVKIHDFLVQDRNSNSHICDYCMAGYILKNTLSDNGTVARGICEENSIGELTKVTETFELGRNDKGQVVGAAKGEDRHEIDEDTLVSMNMWGLTPDIIPVLGDKFALFLENLKKGDIKSEYLLPEVMDDLIREGRSCVKVLPVSTKWYGVTYSTDKQIVTEAINRMTEEGLYKEQLFD